MRLRSRTGPPEQIDQGLGGSYEAAAPPLRGVDKFGNFPELIPPQISDLQSTARRHKVLGIPNRLISWVGVLTKVFNIPTNVSLQVPSNPIAQSVVAVCTQLLEW